MAATITNNYRVFNVTSLLKSMTGSTPSNYLYTFIGNSSQWADTTNTAINDQNPPRPIDCLGSEQFSWRNILALKRVLRSDISAGIRKRNWAYGTYYDIYRHDYGYASVQGVSEIGTATSRTSLADANYYVVTESGNVYICVSNNNGLNASTDNPQNYGTGVNFGVITTSDNYKWKFVASASATDMLKFSTLDFHPVKFVEDQPSLTDSYSNQYLSQENAKTKGGAIYTILVKTGGTSSYSSEITTGITIKGDGTGLTIKAIPNSGTGAIQSIVVLNPGTGYTYCDITISGVTDAVFAPIFTPMDGLGANPPRDLNAHFALINTRLSENEGEGDFTTANDYRQIGILANPLTQGGSLASAFTLDATYRLKVDTGANFTVDAEVLCSNGTKCRVVDWNAETKILRVNLAKPTDPATWSSFSGFSVGSLLTQTTGTGPTNVQIVAYGYHATNDPDSLSGPPEVKYHTGDILYFENRRPIQRDVQQTEDLHIAIEY